MPGKDALETTDSSGNSCIGLKIKCSFWCGDRKGIICILFGPDITMWDGDNHRVDCTTYRVQNHIHGENFIGPNYVIGLNFNASSASIVYLWNQKWTRLWLQMTYPLTVLGKEQAHCWPQSCHGFVKVSLDLNHFQCRPNNVTQNEQQVLAKSHGTYSVMVDIPSKMLGKLYC